MHNKRSERIEHCDMKSQISVTVSSKERLRGIFGKSAKISAGSIQLIGLDTIREELSDRWDAISERVHEYTARMLMKSLASTDVWFRNGEDSYIIVFAHMDKAAAQLVCGRIVDDLHKLLLGHSDTQKVIVHTVVTEMDGGISVQSASLDKLLSDATAQCAHESSKASMNSSTVLNKDLDAASSPEPISLAQPKPFRPRILFRPVFDLRHKVVSTYVCRPDVQTRCYIEISRADELRHEEAVFQLDRETMIQAIDIYSELYDNRFRYAQNLPVHFTTITISRYRREYIQLCRAIPSHLVPFIAFTLEELPTGVPAGRLAEIVTMLKPYGRAVLASAGDASPDVASYAQAGIRGIGITLEAGAKASRATKRIQTLCGMARKYNLFAYVDGICSAELFQAAELAGAAYLAGPAVGADTDVPEHMRRCTGSELIMRARVRAERAH